MSHPTRLLGIVLLALASSVQAAEPPNPVLEKQVTIRHDSTRLQHWLEHIEKRSGVKVRLDDRSFRAAGLTHLEIHTVQLPRPGRSYRLDTILDLITANFWINDHCVAYRAHPDGVELYVRPLLWEMPYESRGEPDRLYLAKLAATKVDLDKGIDANTPLKDALEYLADRYDVDLFIHDAAFAFLGQQAVGEQAVELAPTTDRNLEEVLRLLLEQVGADRLVRPDHVLIVPKLPALPADRRLSRDLADAAWQDLGSGDSRAVFAASRALWADRTGALAFFRERLKPAAALDQDAIMRLLADLDDNDFQVRDKAAFQLELTSERIEILLQCALSDQPALDVRRRIEQIQDRRAMHHRRLSRSVQLLEAMKTPEARQLLEALVKGELRAHLTWEARSALRRLDGRPWIEELVDPRIVIEEPYRIEQPRHPHECPFPDQASSKRR